MSKQRTDQVGVYYHESVRRYVADGIPDRCLYIVFRKNRKLVWEKIGWLSEGYDPEQAVEIRKQRIQEHSLLPVRLTPKNQRMRTRHVGIYYRYSSRRPLHKGKPDRCLEITYKIDGKFVWEKIGWFSEGYTIDDAITTRAARIQERKSVRKKFIKTNKKLNQKIYTVDDAWRVYEEDWLPNLKSGVTLKYEYELYIRPQFGHRLIEGISKHELELFKQKLLAGKNGHQIKSGTVKKILNNFRRVINKLRAWGLITAENPAAGIQVRNAEQKRERYLKQREVFILLDYLQHCSCLLYRIAYISLSTGMRLGEIVQLRGQNIDLDAGVLSIDGKTGQRAVYLPDGVKEILRKILPQTPSMPLFPSPGGKFYNTRYVSSLFAKCIQDLGFNDGITDDKYKCVFHTLRHTFCSWLAQRGVPLFTIGQLVGHASVQMTQRYSKLSPDTKWEALKIIDAELEAQK